MSLLWNTMRPLFPLLDQNPHIVYADNASTVHKPQSVLDAISHYASTSYANIHRGQYELAEQSEQCYLESKKKVSWLIGWDYREIVYTYNATYACNILAQSLVISKKLWIGDVVLVGLWDHHATIVPWQLLAQQFGFTVEFVTIDKETLDIDWQGLSATLSNKKVRVVMCSHVSNVTGCIYDMKRIHSLLSDDVFFAIDWSQAVPHMRVDIRELWCDAYIFTGHKMMWPTGIGVLWIDKMIARSLQTLVGGGGIIEEVTVGGCTLIRTAEKFEPWTPNLMGAVWLGAACDFYQDHSIYDVLPRHEHELIDYLQWLLSSYSSLNIIGIQSSLKKCGILALAVDKPIELAEYLSQYSICVRAGWHCAHPLLHHLWYERGLVRISVFAYNTKDEMRKIAERVGDWAKSL